MTSDLSSLVPFFEPSIHWTGVEPLEAAIGPSEPAILEEANGSTPAAFFWAKWARSPSQPLNHVLSKPYGPTT